LILNPIAQPKIIVIDDDPTGSQTVHSCLLLTKWDVPTVKNHRGFSPVSMSNHSDLGETLGSGLILVWGVATSGTDLVDGGDAIAGFIEDPTGGFTFISAFSLVSGIEIGFPSSKTFTFGVAGTKGTGDKAELGIGFGLGVNWGVRVGVSAGRSYSGLIIPFAAATESSPRISLERLSLPPGL